jgi:peptidoglycan-N-acetylglucosamine deacetylase
MMTFRRTTLAFFLLILGLNMLRILGFPVYVSYYLLLIFIYLGVSITMSFFIRSGYHMKAMCNIITTEKIVALTFDDGPDKELTPKLLDVLKELEIKATFFCIGKKINGNEEMLKRMIAENHIIGTHSFSHANGFDFYLPGIMRNELNNSVQAVQDVIGKKPLFFRPPYGVINPMLKQALKRSNLQVIGFSNRAWDTSSRNGNTISSRIMKNLKPGDVIVLHDTVIESVESVRNIVVQLKQAGYRIVPLDKLLNIPAYEV